MAGHIRHLEDKVFQGEMGLDDLNDYIESLISYVKTGSTDKIYAAIKVDGSPALFI